MDLVNRIKCVSIKLKMIRLQNKIAKFHDNLSKKKKK